VISGITFQLSLDRTLLSEALELATLGADAGVHMLEAGTILILSEGARRVIPALHSGFPDLPIVADIKCTDGGGPEVGMMFDLGATKATVMASASDATIRNAVRETESRDGCEVMVDTMGLSGPDGTDINAQIDSARRARDLGAQYVVLHLGYDERNANPQMVERNLLLRWAEAVARADLGIKVQVVGGLTLAQATQLPAMGISEIVLSMNLGSGAGADTAYDKISTFTVDLTDQADRTRVTSHIRNFIAKVSK